MESSIVSSPRYSSVLEEANEESTWTEYLEDFQDYDDVRREEEEDMEMINSSTCSMSKSSASMVSDAGSGPHWKLRNYNNNNRMMMMMMMMMNSAPKRLNLKRSKDMPLDDSLEDTASSPVNSPKITAGLKRMDINWRRPADETFDTYHGKGKDENEYYQVMKATNNNHGGGGEGQGGKELAEKGFCLVPYTTLMNLNYDYRLPRI